MSGTQRLALIRGINVGGKNLIRMADLRAAFEDLGFDEVRTYIQTGNVFFRAPRERRVELAHRLEADLSRRFSMELKVVLLTERRLRSVIESAPDGFGDEDHKCDAIFLRPPLSVREAMAWIETREGIDQAWTGPEVIYYSRLASRASGSRLSNFAVSPPYKEATIRSWRTVRKLEEMLEAREVDSP